MFLWLLITCPLFLYRLWGGSMLIFFMNDDELSKMLGVKVCFIVCKLLFFLAQKLWYESFVRQLYSWFSAPTNKCDKKGWMQFFVLSLFLHRIWSALFFFFLSSSLETCTDNFSPHDSIWLCWLNYIWLAATSYMYEILKKKNDCASKINEWPYLLQDIRSFFSEL